MNPKAEKRTRSLAGWFAAALFVAVMALGITGSLDPLIRLACSLSLSSFLAVASVLFIRRPKPLPIFAVWLLAVGAGAFVGVAVATSLWGGGALNGRANESRYFLMQHGKETETTRSRYVIVASLETLLFISWPLMFLVAGYNEYCEETERRKRLGTPSRKAV